MENLSLQLLHKKSANLFLISYLDNKILTARNTYLVQILGACD
jgi:hypothetical protein